MSHSHPTVSSDHKYLRLNSCDLSLLFYKTHRVKDDGTTHGLPPGLGIFKIYRVEDYASKLPASIVKAGGFFIGMSQAEAMWISFGNPLKGFQVPVAVNISSGGYSCIDGEKNDGNLRPAGYAVVPPQLWIDGFLTRDGTVSQFVAAPLGAGFTVESQLSGDGSERIGGLQFEVFRMKKALRDAWLDRHRTRILRRSHAGTDEIKSCYGAGDVVLCSEDSAPRVASMGLAAGGRIQQNIHKDPHGIESWEEEPTARVWVHILNVECMEAVTGERPDPTVESHPWYKNTLPTSTKMGSIKTAKEISKEKGHGIHPDLTSAAGSEESLP